MIKNYLNSNNSFLSTKTKNFFFTFLFLISFFSLSSLYAQNFETVSVTSVASGSGTDNALFNVTSSIPGLVFVRAQRFNGEPGIFTQNGDDIRFASSSAVSGIPGNRSGLRFSFLQADGVTLVPVNDFRFKINDIDGPNNEALGTDCGSGVRFTATADPTNIVLDNVLPDLNATGTAVEGGGPTSRAMYEYDDVNVVEMDNYANSGFVKDFDMDNDLAINTPLYSVCDVDTDNDGITDDADLDDDNDGILDSVEAFGNLPNGDNDGDGLPNYLDVSDDTGASATYIANADGSTTNYTDANGNGTPDVYESNDADGDGVPNHLDSDSDNDGCDDALEGSGGFTLGQVDGNGELMGAVDANGVPTLTGPGGQSDVSAYNSSVTSGECDDDNDGIINSADLCPGDDFVDADGDSIPDGCDPDDDNDGISDIDENANCGIGPTTDYIVFNEDFGTGNRTSTPFSNYCYEDGTGNITCSSDPGQPFLDDGEYAILQFAAPYDPNLGGSTFAWDNGGDHTGNAGGRMAVFNASFSPGEFYRRTVSRVIPNIDIDLSFWAKNIVLVGSNAILPNVTIQIRDLSNNILFSQDTGDIPENVTWINYTASFNTGSITEVQFVLIDNAEGGIGNDLVIDDIIFSQARCDSDNDGIANQFDLDSDNDGILDLIEGDGDLDGDGILNFLDIDSDGDGIYDVIEAGHGQADTDGDGMINGLPADFGNNGLYSVIETDDTLSATINYTLLNSDGDALFDFLDVDDDNDGVNTEFENDNADGDGNPTTGVVTDTDGDGTLDYLDVDDDGDGVNTEFENDNADADGNPNTGVVMDTDGDGTLDYLDIDDDGDGVNTEFENDNADADGNPNTGVVMDTDGDGTLDYLDIDDDGDGVNTEFESDNADADGDPTTGVVIDTDGDGTLDYLDIDDDGDGVNSEFENDNADADGDPTTGVVVDTDGDGTLDYLDIDDDGDGVNSEFENDNADADGDPTTGVVVDTDGDGTLDYLDVDDDGDGVNTEFESDNADADGDPTTGVVIDTDGDGTLDYLDVDDDGDGVLTEDENPDPNIDGNPIDAQDSDGDSTPDYLDTDDDNDGIDTADEDADGDNNPTNDDTDGDGVPNYLDLDSDNDGIPDSVEGNGDSDGDGIADYIDLDSDNDGIPDIIEAGGIDTDGDGQIDYPILGDPTSLDDANGNGLDDTIEATPLPLTDTDGDGFSNYLDLDSDADGISDIIEAGGVDADGDAHVDYVTSGDPSTMTDVNLNGLLDSLEGAGLPIPNTDGTGGEDYIDIDADGDGIVDNIEGQTTANYIAPAGTDVDNDGLDDNYDGDDGNTIGVIDPLGPFGDINPTNTDGLDNPDYLDLDSDNDGDSDSLEGWDTDNDGIANIVPSLGDADGDGLDNAYDVDDSSLDPTNGGTVPTDFPNLDVTPLDTDRDWREGPDNDSDNDGVDDAADLDDDNDGIPDTDESGGNDPNGDADGDGIPNYLDITDGGGAGDGSTTDYTDLDFNGIPDVYDTDGDGVPNHLDLDSDNDGIYDLVESGQLNGVNVLDNVSDGIIDGSIANSGANGLFNFIESDDSSTATLLQATADSTADNITGLPAPNGIFDAYELDADNDGCNDLVEAGFEAEDTEPNGILGADVSLVFDVNGLVDLPASGLTLGYTVPTNANGATTPLDFQEFNFTTTITTQPSQPAPILAGTTITIVDLVTTGDTYQWQVSTTGSTGPYTDILFTDTDYSGSQTNELTINNTPASFGGNYYQVLVSTSSYACDTQITSTPVQLIILGDNDGDTVADVTDLDDDNDGIPDTVESGGNEPDGDEDGDGTPNWQDTVDDGDVNVSPTDYTDADGNGIPDVYDTDGDGVPNHLDLDSDNDGIYDLVESGQLDTDTGVNNNVVNNNGVIGAANAGTVGANGLFDPLEDGPESGSLTTPTLDSTTINGVLTPNGIPDSLELNSDGDGCNDVLEAGFTDPDANGLLGNGTFGAGLTVNMNGVVSSAGVIGVTVYTEPNDLDGGTYDYREFGEAVTIDTQSSSTTVILNATANFDVTLGSGVVPTYEWFISTDGGINFTSLVPDSGVHTGTETDTLTIDANSLTLSGNQYYVTISAPGYACAGSVSSIPVTLTVDSDLDGDGIGDETDLDSDNDGIPNTDEYPNITDPTLNNPYGDPDGDGTPNYLDPQPNNGAVVGDGSTVNPDYDFDGDGIPNHLDTDADGDGIFDAIEAGHGFINVDVNGFIIGADTGSGTNGLFDAVEDNDTAFAVINYPITDTDNDGNSNFLDIDDDNDGIDTIDETPNGDTDGDGVANHLDIDDDNDGILTATEGGTANDDADSFPNYLDQDADGDGIADNVEGQSTVGYVAPTGNDSDGDGLDDAYDLFDNNTVSDTNNNNTSTNGIQPVDTDSGTSGADGNPDYLDTDTDGDGVPDSIEGHDLDNDGVADNFPTTDSDNDGLNDAFDGSIGDFGDPNGAIVITDPATDLPDTDSTEDVNFRDVDDDGDGVYTIYESLLGDTDLDGIPNYLDNDDDDDGILTADENPDPNGDGNPDDAQDLDNDGTPDYLDGDDDNDGIDTVDEGTDDTDGDGRPDYLDIDDDNDGIITIVETNNDEDGDGQPNHLDLDADGDGIPDNVEGQTTSGYVLPSGVDSDNDGLDDAYDNDTDGSNQLANFESGNGIQPVNTDVNAVLNSDGDPDYLDTDSDGDTVPDSIEGHNFNAEFGPDIEPSGNDVDMDGLDDAYDSDLTGFGDPNGNVVDTNPATDLPNFDGVDEVNYRDLDDDNDGIDTAGEDGDMSGDAIRDDCDEDGNPNYVDVVPCDRVPSGFSPNDDGNNDTFIIPALDQYPNFTMEVYDRWGNRIYDYDNAGREDVLWWDGFSSGSRTIQKGQKVPVGTYYYIINFNQDRISPIAGWVYINY